MIVTFDYCTVSLKDKEGKEVQMKVPTVYFRSRTGVEGTHFLTPEENDEIVKAYIGIGPAIDRTVRPDDSEIHAKVFAIHYKVSEEWVCLEAGPQMADIMEISGLSDKDRDRLTHAYLKDYVLYSDRKRLVNKVKEWIIRKGI